MEIARVVPASGDEPSPGKQVRINEAPVVHIVENWKEFNYTPKQQKEPEVTVIKTEFELKIERAYDSFKLMLKDMVSQCGWL